MNKPTRVLIADDSEDDQMLFRQILKAFNAFKVIGTTTGGDQTVAYLNGEPPYDNRRVYPDPDLVFLDFEMPFCSGMDVLYQTQKKGSRRTIVLWSDATEMINPELAHRLGATIVCSKPKARTELLEILTRALLPSTAYPVAYAARGNASGIGAARECY
jgi:CheY-like chemotaxis protein